MVVDLLQVVALCMGNSAGPFCAPLFETAEYVVISSSAHTERCQGLPNRNAGVDVMHAHTDYFVNSITSQDILDSEMGDYFLFLFLSYLDFYKNDNVVATTNDWVTTMPQFDPYDQSPIRFLSVYSSNMMSWITSYAANSAQVSSYEVPSGYPHFTYEYFYYFLAAYLSDRGFVQTTPSITGDFELSFMRSNIGWLGNGSSCNIYVPDDNANLAINAVEEGWLAVFNPNQDFTNLPFIVVGYEVDVLPNDERIYLKIHGYNPRYGVHPFSFNKIYEITALNFHTQHAHSNNAVTSTPHHEYCACGFELCLDGHSLSGPSFLNLSSHQYTCSNCDYVNEESHDFHYQRVNNLKHRKYCTTCGFSFLENHYGTYCICQLADGPSNTTEPEIEEHQNEEN